MPNANIPKITDETPGYAPVYVKNPADDSIGQCTVDQYRDLYETKGWKLASPDEHAEHMAALANELREVQAARPDLLYPESGTTAAQRATSRSNASSKEG